MAVVTMRQLLESGVHFGHQTRRWNPKMKRFIMTERNGIYIIDLQQSLTYINDAFEFVKETVSHGGTILFVGTKKQAQESISEQATRVGMPYVNHRWLGGMLTNFNTVHKRLTRLKELEEIDFDDVAASGRTKKELLTLSREKNKLERSLGGIRDMNRVPSAVWIVDTKKEHLAVTEARKLNLPVIAILDTNCDPDEVDYKIPGNDDAIRSVALLTRVVADAVAEGLITRSSGRTGADGEEADGSVAADEPMAEWERELLGGQAADAGAASGTQDAAPAAPESPAPESSAVESPAVESPAVESPAVESPAVSTDPAPSADAAVEAAPAGTDEPALEAAATDTTATSEPAVEATSTAPVADEPAPEPQTAAPTSEYGPASAAALTDGSAPEGFSVKGNRDSMKYHTPQSQWYDQTEAEVWFRTAEDAEAAGFAAPGAG